MHVLFIGPNFINRPENLPVLTQKEVIIFVIARFSLSLQYEYNELSDSFFTCNCRYALGIYEDLDNRAWNYA